LVPYYSEVEQKFGSYIRVFVLVCLCIICAFSLRTAIT